MKLILHKHYFCASQPSLQYKNTIYNFKINALKCTSLVNRMVEGKWKKNHRNKSFTVILLNKYWKIETENQIYTIF